MRMTATSTSTATEAQVLAEPAALRGEPFDFDFDLIDTHAHLDDTAFDADRAQVVERARRAGVGVVLVSTDLASSARSLELAETYGLRCAVGLHPHRAREAGPDLEARLEALAERPQVVALGEMGLDFYRDLSPREVQRDVLERQLALATDLDLPVVLHNREATEELLAVLRAHPGVRGVWHSFLGTRREAEAFLELGFGFYLGLGGPLTYKANDALREAAAALPLERIVLETDSPYLTPVPHRGRRNEPAYLPHVAEALARVRGRTPAEIAAITTRNARRLFDL